MNRRVVAWGTALTVAGGLILVFALHAILTFVPHTDNAEQVLTLGQLMAVLFGAVLAVIGLGLLVQTARHRRRRTKLARVTRQ